jgi:hypothetical protein
MRFQKIQDLYFAGIFVSQPMLFWFPHGRRSDKSRQIRNNRMGIQKTGGFQ